MMFGHQDKNKSDLNGATGAPVVSSADGNSDASMPTLTDSPVGPPAVDSDSSQPMDSPTTSVSSMSSATSPIATEEPNSPDNEETPVVAEANSEPVSTDANTVDTATSDDVVRTSSSDGTAPSDDLMGLKQKALEQLTPLVGELDQSPEERFHTTMMMIQASDNQSLIQKAYEAAEQISDSKVRAQALLDIVNEINYFTQHPSA